MLARKGRTPVMLLDSYLEAPREACMRKEPWSRGLLVPVVLFS